MNTIEGNPCFPLTQREIDIICFRPHCSAVRVRTCSDMSSTPTVSRSRLMPATTVESKGVVQKCTAEDLEFFRAIRRASVRDQTHGDKMSVREESDGKERHHIVHIIDSLFKRLA